MPTYDYAGEACGHEFERIQRITEKPLKKCPKCGEDEARRMIGGGAFILKGGGWESVHVATPSCRLCGDCNLNSLGPNILDALKAAQFGVALHTPYRRDMVCCDVNLSEQERETRLRDWLAAPHAQYCHPRGEHLMPAGLLWCRPGSGTSGLPGTKRRIHHQRLLLGSGLILLRDR